MTASTVTAHEKLLALIDRDIAVCEAATWKSEHPSGAVAEHSLVLGGVLCRWWYSEPPEGVRLVSLQPATLKAIRDVVRAHPPRTWDGRLYCDYDACGDCDWPCPTWLSLSAPWSEEVERG